MLRRAVLANLLVVSIALLGSACSGTSTVSLRTETTGTLTWKPCGHVQCASLSVPLDWNRPDYQHITLALARLPARHAHADVLLTNPGGPGASGVDFASQATNAFDAKVLDHFDIVSWDPRGVSRSAPVNCLDNLDAFYAANHDPKSPAEVAAHVATNQTFVDACRRNSAPELPYVSSYATAHDMDAIRAAMGVDRISYFGFSYGTFLGELYAQMYPARVDTMVLDGVVDPALSFRATSVQQAAGFDDELKQFFTWCRSHGSCGFARGGDPEAAYNTLQHDIADESIPATVHGESRTLGPGEFDVGVASALYAGEAGFEDLAKALAQAAQGQGDQLLAFSDQYTERSPGAKYSNGTAAMYAIGCIDAPGPRTVDELAADASAAAAAAPHFGASTVWLDLPCVQWPVAPVAATGPIAAPGAPPILVVGTTHDPATPYAWAQSVAGELKSGHLLTYDGTGHTAYARGDDCIDGAVDAYLTAGTLPAPAMRCT